MFVCYNETRLTFSEDDEEVFPDADEAHLQAQEETNDTATLTAAVTFHGRLVTAMQGSEKELFQTYSSYEEEDRGHGIVSAQSAPSSRILMVHELHQEHAHATHAYFCGSGIQGHEMVNLQSMRLICERVNGGDERIRRVCV